MIHDNLRFHNVAELVPAQGGGLHLARFPSGIWKQAEAPMGCDTIRSSNGSEIQFVTDKPRARLYLRSLVGNADLIHLVGNQVYCYETIEAGKIHCLDLSLPNLEKNRKPTVRQEGGYSPKVYRVVSVGATLAYHGIDGMGGNLRAPTAEELPRRTCLAYGSSITQSRANFHNYVNTATQMLNAAVYNLGMGGSCWIEPAIADFIASRNDWDFASFELGINMVNANCDNKRFAEKVDYLLKTVTEKHPEKPIFLLTILQNGIYHELEPSNWQKDVLQKNAILTEAAAKYASNVTLIDGANLVPDFRGFQIDLLHPEPIAFVRMGLKLAELMAPVLEAKLG